MAGPQVHQRQEYTGINIGLALVSTMETFGEWLFATFPKVFLITSFEGVEC